MQSASEAGHHPPKVCRRRDIRRGDEKAVALPSGLRARAGVHDDAFGQGEIGGSCRGACRGGERALAALAGHELHSGEQPQTPDVAHDWQLAELIAEQSEKLGLDGRYVLDKQLAPEDPDDCGTDRGRYRVTSEREVVLETSGAFA